MGTRNLTMVRLNGALKVANYGQWDGYPTGQGETVAAFVQAYLRHKTTRAEFADKVAKLTFATDAECEAMNADWEATEAKHAKQAKKGHHVSKYEMDKFAPFNRDTGAGILKLINDGLEITTLKDNSEFLKDTLFCEWAYCVDLDAGTVDVYHGDVTPAATITFAKFTVYSMRALEKKLRAQSVWAATDAA